MPKVKVTCDYCGDKWSDYVYSTQQKPKCEKCKSDSHVKLKLEEDEDTDVFGYNKK